MNPTLNRAGRAWNRDRLLGKDDSGEKRWSSPINYLSKSVAMGSGGANFSAPCY